MAIDTAKIYAGFRSAMTDNAALMDKIKVVYRDMAIEGAQFPYIVYFAVSGHEENTFSEEVDGILFQVNIWAKNTSSKMATTIIDEIVPLADAALTRVTLTIADYEAPLCYRLGFPVTLPITADQESAGIRGRMLQYRVIAYKSK